MFAIVGVMYGLLKYRDATVKLPVDREQLARIPAYGLQQQIQDLQMDLIGRMLMGLMMLHILVDVLISTFRLRLIRKLLAKLDQI